MHSVDSRHHNARAWAGFLAGAGVGAACMYLIDPNNGARRRALLRDKSMAGAGFLLRAATSLESRRLIGAVSGRRAVDIQKTIHIGAPVERVFDFWTHLENFPHFMRNVLDVEHTRVEGHYRWRLSGAAHVPIEFDAVITRFEPNRVLAWKTVPGSAVEHAGVIYFEPDEAGGTRVHIQFSYNPPAGAIGHAIAALAGADPKAKMDEDLARLKTTIETGHPPRDAARPLSRAPEARM